MEEVTKDSWLDHCIDWGLANKFWVLSFSVLLTAATAFNLKELTVDAVPDITNVQVVINTKTQGLDPEKVELTVTQPIEFEMMGLARIHDLRSISKFGLSQVTLIFEDGTDIYWARQQVAEKLQTAIGALPQGMAPELAPISTGLGEVFMYALRLKPDSALRSKSHSEQMLYLREIQDFVIRPQLRKIKDVADVDSNGGFKKELHLNINPNRLSELGLTLKDIEERLAGLGESFGGGTVAIDKEAMIVKSSTQMQSEADFADISLGLRYNGAPIRLADVAKISVDAAPRLGSATLDGEETVLGTVLMKSGGNGRAVSATVEEEIGKLKLPEDVVIKQLYSRAFLVNTTLTTVIKNLSEGALLVVVILLVVLGHLRAALIVSLIIPLSMLGTTFGMQQMHISGNLMSLGAIDFGLVVDGAVVLVETLVASFYALTPEERKRLNKDQLVAAKARTVMRPVFFGLMMIMLVYIPIFALEGVEGKMFRPLAITVLMTLGWSLIFTVFLIPVLVSLFVKLPEKQLSEEEHDTWFFKKLKSLYRPVLFKVLDKPHAAIGVGVVLALLSGVTFWRLGADFIPQLDEGDLVVNITRNSRISLEEALNEQYAVEKVVAKFPEVQDVFSRLGTPESATDPMGVHLTDMFLLLNKDRSTWRFKSKDELSRAIQSEIKKLGFEQELSSTQPIEMRFNEMLEGSRADVSVRVIGADLDYLMQVNDELTAKIEKVPGLESVEMDPLTALRKGKVIDIRPNITALAKLGVTLDGFNQTVVGFMQGARIGEWIRGTRKYSIVAHLSEEFRDDLAQIKKLPVSLPGGGTVPLDQVASVELKEQVTTIARNWGNRYAALSLNIGERDTTSFVKDVRAIVDGHKLKPEHRIQLGGQFNNLERARGRLLVIIPLTLIVIFVILWREFGSVKDTAVIFLCVPFAAFGGIFALYARDIHLSLSAAVGFIALIGIALLNGIVLLTVFQQLQKAGKGWREVVVEGTLSRLRPVVMTALVASIGFLPMALNTGLGSEVQRPLATVVIGGILFSTLLTLLLLPTVYLFAKSRE